MNSDKGNYILLMILVVATLLVAVAGTTFAYFGATINKDDELTTIEVTSGTLSIEYDDNSKISNGSVLTGEVLASKNFSVTGVVTGSSNLFYQVYLNINSNTYSSGSLVYTLTSNNESGNGVIISSTSEPIAIPSGENKILIGKGNYVGPISSGAKHTYTLTITYIGNNDYNGTLDANISFEQLSN